MAVATPEPTLTAVYHGACDKLVRALERRFGLNDGWLVRRLTGGGTSPQGEERKSTGESTVPSTTNRSLGLGRHNRASPFPLAFFPLRASAAASKSPDQPPVIQAPQATPFPSPAGAAALPLAPASTSSVSTYGSARNS